MVRKNVFFRVFFQHSSARVSHRENSVDLPEYINWLQKLPERLFF